MIAALALGGIAAWLTLGVTYRPWLVGAPLAILPVLIIALAIDDDRDDRARERPYRGGGAVG